MWNFALELVSKGILKEVDFTPECILSCFCAEKGDNIPGAPKGYRFLVNGRPLKEFLEVPHFRLEDLSSLVAQMTPGVQYEMIKVDLKDAFFCTPIPGKDQTYFGICLLDPQGNKHYFVFRAICQGTSQSSYVFDRLLKPVLRYWRRNSQGATIIFVDDAIGAASSVPLAIKLRNALIHALIGAGFIINWKKCVLDPNRIMLALGFILNFENSPATIAPSDKRISATLALINQIIDDPSSATPRVLCSI
jgi:hypothetical protein